MKYSNTNPNLNSNPTTNPNRDPNPDPNHRFPDRLMPLQCWFYNTAIFYACWQEKLSIVPAFRDLNSQDSKNYAYAMMLRLCTKYN